ncbi:hypothetical protein PPTG_21275 [Phytophthora nicotianae INRA-310]|uniref:Uncharacterized protein n=4 Tax=Phytophthora nicotianae TaxID=4792 RepID=W2R6J9_PHYN3|nr:hypothetical protein PPTG_21275 [Phytophthora nicotianae INRA-310]ETN20319.1 hypothetical protein PPTG_21275 [Phytophthora nicotianae INRA-310]
MENKNLRETFHTPLVGNQAFIPSSLHNCVRKYGQLKAPSDIGPFWPSEAKIIGAWDALAAKLVAEASFLRLKLSDETEENEKSMAVSGVSEEESERAIVLDELIELVDDHIES